MNKHATLWKDTNILSGRWVFGFITNNPHRVDPLMVESVPSILNDKRFKVRSLVGRFCDISELFFGRMAITQKLKCKIPEWNKGNEYVFNPIVNFKSKLCDIAQYPVINIREVHIPLHLWKKCNGSRFSTWNVWVKGGMVPGDVWVLSIGKNSRSWVSGLGWWRGRKNSNRSNVYSEYFRL